MDMPQRIASRIAECQEECRSYTDWLRQLRGPNFFLVGLGSLLSFLGGAAVLADVSDNSVLVGLMGVVGGALTGLHNWLGCEKHQAECERLSSEFDALATRYETLQSEPENTKHIELFREIEADLARAKGGRRARPWKRFWKFAT